MQCQITQSEQNNTRTKQKKQIFGYVFLLIKFQPLFLQQPALVMMFHLMFVFG